MKWIFVIRVGVQTHIVVAKVVQVLGSGRRRRTDTRKTRVVRLLVAEKSEELLPRS
jgi:hypothetical protein